MCDLIPEDLETFFARHGRGLKQLALQIYRAPEDRQCDIAVRALSHCAALEHLAISDTALSLEALSALQSLNALRIVIRDPKALMSQLATRRLPDLRVITFAHHQLQSREKIERSISTATAAASDSGINACIRCLDKTAIELLEGMIRRSLDALDSQ